MKAAQKKTLKTLLKQIKQGQIKTKDAAATLSVSARHFNRLMLEANVTRPEGKRKVQDEAALAKKAKKVQAMHDILSGKYTLAKAAVLAECSERTLIRYLKAHRGW